MESISIIKRATTVKKEAEKVQRQKKFFFAQIPQAFIQCIVCLSISLRVIRESIATIAGPSLSHL